MRRETYSLFFWEVDGDFLESVSHLLLSLYDQIFPIIELVAVLVGMLIKI